MIFNLGGFQKTLIFWAKALVPVEGTRFFQKEIQMQFDLVFCPYFTSVIKLDGFDYETILFCGVDLFGLFTATFNWTRRGDHPGVEIQLRVIFFDLRFQYRDLRHWNYDNDCFKAYDEI